MNEKNYTCLWVDKHTGERCTKEGFTSSALKKSNAHLPLCRAHNAELFNRTVQHEKEQAPTAENNKDKQAYNYAVELTEKGTYKLGWTSDLKARFMDLSYDHNDGKPVRVLGVIKGGPHTEDLMHVEWTEYRIWDEYGEQFRKAPELNTQIGMMGIDPTAQEVVSDYVAITLDEEAWLRETEKSRDRHERRKARRPRGDVDGKPTEAESRRYEKWHYLKDVRRDSLRTTGGYPDRKEMERTWNRFRRGVEKLPDVDWWQKGGHIDNDLLDKLDRESRIIQPVQDSNVW